MLEDFSSMRLFNVLLAASQIFGVADILLVVTWMVYEGGYGWSENPEKQFHYHPTLMVMGILFVAGEAILVYRVLLHETKRFTKLVHLSLHAVVLVLIIVSLKAVWDSHDYHRDNTGALKPIPNLYSFHSWVGLTVVTCYFLQYAAGFITFWYPGLNMRVRMLLMPFHRFFGFLIFMFVGITVLMGITEFAAWKHTCWTKDGVFCGEQLLGNMVGVCTISFIALVSAMVLNPQWRRMPSPEESRLHEQYSPQ